MNLTPLESRLAAISYVQLRYRLEFVERGQLPAFALLRLRRELSRLLNSELVSPEERAVSWPLLKPELPRDPYVRRRVQQPAPGFVFTSTQRDPMSCLPGEFVEVEVLFLGRAVLQVVPLTRLLSKLGHLGLHGNCCRYVLRSIVGVPSGVEIAWKEDDFSPELQMQDLSDCVFSSPPTQFGLEFLTPTRLLQHGKPLFKCGFADLFPFILRRVTALCSFWGGDDDLFDISGLLAAVQAVKTEQNQLTWSDWRPLAPKEEAGGLLGQLFMGGEGVAELWPILRLGELFGVGKGAAFGAGQYRIMM